MNDQLNPKTKGEAFERLAFTFCKIATFCLLTQRFALPLAASGAALFFILAHFSGHKETRCIGKHPLLIATFWVAVVGIWIWRAL
jgi:hypothetical protein